MTGRLEGKVAFITGAARGQGRSHAVALAREGADIIAVDVSGPVRDVAYAAATADDLAQTVEEVKAVGGRIVARQADVRDAAALEVAVRDGIAEFGRLDVVVANAAILVQGAWNDITPEIWQNTIDINLTGVWNTVMATAPRIVEQGEGGSIILVSSASGLKALPFLTPYTASKFGVTGLAKGLAVELAKDRIRVNSLHPCGVGTAMVSQASQAAAAEMLAGNPRLGAMRTNLLDVGIVEPSDVSNAVVFLASEESRYVTALAMTVDAGNTQY
jgi:SDR family mycofactocin-dependent oxidoreductase